MINMHNSIRSLLEEVVNESFRSKKFEQHVSGIIWGFESKHSGREQFLTCQIRLIKRYVKEIIVSLPVNYQIQDSTLENELKEVKIVERDLSLLPYSTDVFNALIQKSLNNKILFLPYDYDISKAKIEILLKHNFPLVTFLGKSGNLLPSVGLIDKWINRFNLQLTRICKKKNLDDLYRISSNVTYFRLINQDSIMRKTLDSNDLLRTIRRHDIDTFFPFKVQYPVDEQALVKSIAIMHILQRELEEKQEITSSFKVQQLLTLSQRFSNYGHNFLAFQTQLFLLLRYQNNIKFPLDWSIDRITEQARRLLLEESRIFAEKGLERLRYVCLSNLLSLNLAKEQDIAWINEEIPKIKDVLEKDNIESHFED